MNLPPATPHLRHGLGVGTQRAYAASPRTVRQPAETRPERETTVLRSGILRGGIEGVLAHHTFLGRAPGDNLWWAERASTIVYAELPAANRLVSHAAYGHREPVQAALTLSFNGREAIPPAPVRTGPPVTVPDGVFVEIEHGVLCARIDGRVMDPAQLDALCRAASAVADAIRQVAAGGSVLDPEVVAHMLGSRGSGGPLSKLNDREGEVLALMAEGKTNRAIAKTLYMSERAVERHVTAIFTKLQLPVTDEDHRRVLAVLAYTKT